MEKINLVGHSMGAILAGAYATKYPGHIGRLILASPPGLKNRLPQDERAIYDSSSDRFGKFLNRPAIAEELSKYNLNRSSPALSSIEETRKFRIQVFSRMVVNVSKAAEINGGRALYKANVNDLTEKTYPVDGWNYIAEFAKQSYPVTIIEGDQDFVDFGNGLAKKWCREVPRIRLEIVKDAGHFLWLDDRDAFQKKLSAALTN